VREAIHGGAGVQNSASGSFAGSVPSSRSPDSHGGQPMAGRVSAYYGGLAGMASKTLSPSSSWNFSYRF